jgi:GTP-binding protein YchF
MKVGIVGYPGVGKSTVFAALTGLEPAEVLGETRLAVADVVDERLDDLRAVFEPKKFTRARFEVEDGLVLPTPDLRGRGEAVVSLRGPDALLVTVGGFVQSIAALDSSLHDPAAQLQSFRDDLALLDLELLEGRLSRLEGRIKRGAGDRVERQREVSILEEILNEVEGGVAVAAPADRTTARILAELRLFAHKPVIPVLNVDESAIASGGYIEEWLPGEPLSATLSAPVEREIAMMDAEDRHAFLAEYGLTSPASERLTRLAYDALDLITFFTVGEDEVRAWPAPRGSTAVEAAGKIHTDLARGFIRAEVTAHDRITDVKNARDFKAAGAMELKGKDYVVQDGDIMNIRFSV